MASLICFRAACVVIVLTAAAHATSHFQPKPEPASEPERQLMQLMKTVEFPAPGATLTVERLLNGFSWHFTGSLAALGVLGIVLGWSREAMPSTRRPLAAVMGGALVLAAVNSQVHFFLIPTAMLALSALLMVGSFVLAPRGGVVLRPAPEGGRIA